MQLAGLLPPHPRSRPVDVVTAEAEQVVKILVLYVKLEPLVIIFPLFVFAKNDVCRLPETIECFFFFFSFLEMPLQTCV